MIDIKKLTERDIGREVIYCNEDHHRKAFETATESGVITSYNDTYIFINYESMGNLGRGIATNPRHLSFRRVKLKIKPKEF